MRLTFSTDDLPETDRVAAWHDLVCRQIYPVTPAALRDTAVFRARVAIVGAGPLALIDLATSNGDAARTAADVARDSSERAVVYRALGRRQHYRFGGDEFVFEPGEICIAANRTFACAAAGGLAFQALAMPLGMVTPLLARGHAQRPGLLPRESPMGVLLGAALDTAAAQVPLLEAGLGAAVLGSFSGLVAIAWGASRDGQAQGQDELRLARLTAIKRHIAAHLTDPGLSPAGVAAALGVSPRYLHRSFELGGESFAQYVMACRLEACRAALEAPRSPPRTVADVAFSSGFNSLATFYRAFQARFGKAPGELRQP